MPLKKYLKMGLRKKKKKKQNQKRGEEKNNNKQCNQGSVSHCFLEGNSGCPTKGSAANYKEGFTNVLATKKQQQCSTREVIAPLQVLLLVYCKILLLWKELLTLK